MVEKKTIKDPTYLREIEVKFKKKRVSADAPTGQILTDPNTVVELFRDMQNEGKEKIIAISLNIKLKIIAFEVVNIGTPRSVYAQPGEITRTPVMVAASGMIVVHNHPSGDPSPSEEDRDFTWHLTVACEVLRIPLHDHVIIGEDDFYSFAADGWIEKFQRKAREQIEGQRPK
ncbi:MAG: DNA repair protein RadC [Gammaproteobacteria bacterium]|nr:DNA repair protein RadC [Gammaproteobacteria bacterium]